MRYPPIIALLTDFGLQDGYVGVMKGVISQISPHATIIDLNHQIPPQDVMSARFCLLSSVEYFPPGTIFVAVVDPGVGSLRRGIAIAWHDYYLIAPDNGLLSGLLEQMPADQAIILTNPAYWRVSQPSTTFHGRDIFAPVAAHLANGVALADLGDRIAVDSLVRLSLPPLTVTDDGIIATIQSIDHFGNAVTTIPAQILHGRSWMVKIGTILIPNRETYSQIARGKVIAVIGSHGWVEIAVNGGNAAKKIDLQLCDRINLIWT